MTATTAPLWWWLLLLLGVGGAFGSFLFAIDIHANAKRTWREQHEEELSDSGAMRPRDDPSESSPLMFVLGATFGFSLALAAAAIYGGY